MTLADVSLGDLTANTLAASSATHRFLAGAGRGVEVQLSAAGEWDPARLVVQGVVDGLAAALGPAVVACLAEALHGLDTAHSREATDLLVLADAAVTVGAGLADAVQLLERLEPLATELSTRLVDEYGKARRAESEAVELQNLVHRLAGDDASWQIAEAQTRAAQWRRDQGLPE